MKNKCIILALLLSFVQGNAQTYSGKNIDRIAFPIGGMGAGMFCVEGTGAISHMSVRNTPDVFNEPLVFAALSVKGHPASARVLEGPVPEWKISGLPRSGDGAPGRSWGLPRMEQAVFTARFPFAEIALSDTHLPVKVSLRAWNPFIPTDENHSSLPVGGLEYSFSNTGKVSQELVFSYHAQNFMALSDTTGRIAAMEKGFVLEDKGAFAVYTDEPSTIVDYSWFRGMFYDPLSMTWNHIERGETIAVPALDKGALGASLYVPFVLRPGQHKTIRLYLCWYVPNTRLRRGWSLPPYEASVKSDSSVADQWLLLSSAFHQPWYASQFNSIGQVAEYWTKNYDSMKYNTELFTKAFYASTLPPEVTEAVAANLAILKSPTVLRQYDGRFWGWEGSHDRVGSCPGSCTHVWNYAQAVPHLFPRMERSLRETEFGENQNTEGHQSFRAMIPIRILSHDFYAAADGQFGGLMKVYRDWRISGDSVWLRGLYPKLKLSLDYCIRTWDPRHTGTLEEPHHNTYDIEFWGANGFTTSFYLGALEAFIAISDYLHEDAGAYASLLHTGRQAIETKLYNGEYFFQQIQWTGLSSPNPLAMAKGSFGGEYSPEAIALLQKEGPKYQYGKGCLSDGVLGAWMARVCGLEAPFDTGKINSHLISVYKYNFKTDLRTHANPQRPTYALGREGGLLLCTWPKGGKLSLPFVYSNEVWTGIEYQVASHLIFTGHLKEGLEIVRTARARYDGRVRNPFDEYECGHWYARAMSSYALIEACTGVRYDAVTKTLYVDSRVGDFVSFLSTETGFGNVVYKKGKVTVKVVYGEIEVEHIVDSTR
jgi:uncharacterized protein (DUF608 family)